MQVGVEKRNIIIVVFTLVAVVLLIRLLSLQVFDDYYKQAASNNAFYNEVQYPARGLIYDRNGKELVVNRTVYDIMAIPREVKDVDSAEICRALKVDLSTLRQLFAEVDKKKKGASGYQFVTFMKQVPAETYALFQEKSFKFHGFYTQVRTSRSYVRNISGNLLGYIGEVDKEAIQKNPYYQQGDYIGKTGIEESYEDVLRGKKGVSIYLRDVHNRIKQPYNNGESDSAAVAGKSIVCTIDGDLQEYAERLMVNKIGSIVAIEPATGEILSMVSSPGFSPALLMTPERGANYDMLSRDKYKPMFNRAIMSSMNPPGSTFKLANALIGLQEGVVTPDTRYGCSMGYKVGRGVGCHAHPSPLDMEHSIMMSCNAYYCHVFRNIIDNPKYGGEEGGLERWVDYVESFGFGPKLGTDLVGERSGKVPSVSSYDKIHRKGNWKSLTIISLAIGQGEIGATPLQLANFCAIIANRGYYIIPHIVKEIEDDSVSSKYHEKHYAKVDSKHYETIVDGMYLAVNSPPGSGATASRVQIPGISMCGKTGTAQNPHGEDNAVFFCFAPKDNPKIAIAVYVENAGFGGTYAAPIASLMVEKYLTGKVERAYMEESVLSTDLRSKWGNKKRAK